MKARLGIVILALLASGLWAGASNQQQSYLGAYVIIAGATRREYTQDYLGALARYEAAEKILTKVQAKDQHWEATLVKRRLGDCELKIAELKPLAAFQLAQLHNEWTIDSAAMEGKDPLSALLRAQAKVTYLEVMQINHPELAKAGMGDGMKEADKNVDGMVEAMVAKDAQN